MIKLKSLYIESLHEQLWQSVKHDLLTEASSTEAPSKLQTLLDLADKHVFEPMGIDPKDKVYFIAGSARIFLYPELIKSVNIDRDIGDIDIVVPNIKYWEKARKHFSWENAKKEKLYNEGWEFKVDGKSLSVFSSWDPRKGADQALNYQVADTKDILNRADLIDGHWFMDFADIIDYKMRLGRKKEEQFVKLFMQYKNASLQKRAVILRRIIRLIGYEEAKQFLDMTKLGKEQAAEIPEIPDRQLAQIP
jgi:hypothetical protein